MKWESKGKKKTYSIRRLVNSFKYAVSGIINAYKTEQNLLVHTIIAVIVIVVGILLKLSTIEFAIVALVIGFVIVSEMFNTSIEYTVDMAMPSKHPLAKIAKDVASGACLLSAITSVAVGLLIYLPKIIDVLS